MLSVAFIALVFAVILLDLLLRAKEGGRGRGAHLCGAPDRRVPLRDGCGSGGAPRRRSRCPSPKATIPFVNAFAMP